VSDPGITPKTSVMPCPRPEEIALALDQTVCLLYRDDKGELVSLPLAGRVRTTIGRDAACDLVLPDNHVSRRHAAIELVEGQHLLRDEGSSNGTFLNGLRLSRSHAFALRERDVIEIGSRKILYGRAAAISSPTTPRGELAASYDQGDLVRDGLDSLAGPERARVQNAVFAALGRGPFAAVAPAILSLALDLLDGQTAALFMLDARRALRVVAALPCVEAAGGLVPTALRVAGDGRGHLARGLTAIEDWESRSTSVELMSSVAAAPVGEAREPLGVLVVERVSAARLDRKDLALLAVVAERVAQGLALSGKGASDTRLGYAG